ncbi:MAG: tRNA (adenosine(37)-N6)-threonylcarbamoyltransferase complex transferase subunit TsaD [Bacteroidales bacterium]|nr:tRNA (adenosine(37)-N6)-threonylcarbamoyltransferase complex transferase subunit TsaD [Bacteroidales bacterium]
MHINILAIESSCDDTSAAVMQDTKVLSNVIAGQDVHFSYGGVVPELASRAHQQHIIPVVDTAIVSSGLQKTDIDAVAYTNGPGLLGSLMVGTSFAKAFALAINIPLIEVDHLDAHIMAHFIAGQHPSPPEFPFLCLTVSGGHTQITVVKDHLHHTIIGKTIDDAAGEAFDKAAKILGLGYPGGPIIDKLAKKGNKHKFLFSEPKIAGLDFSYSGLKTSFLYHIRDNIKKDPDYITNNINSLVASIQETIINILIHKVTLAAKKTGITTIALAGGVSANSALRERILEEGEKNKWKVFIPNIEYTTDNAAMIGITGYYKYKAKLFSSLDATPYTRSSSK